MAISRSDSWIPFYSDGERKESENMRQLREKYNLDDSSTGVVTKDDIEDAVARWTGVPMTAIKEEEVTKLLRIDHRENSPATNSNNCQTPQRLEMAPS
jgi:ATP-dependent Clp protease ATP-binding subunit ClpA